MSPSAYCENNVGYGDTVVEKTKLYFSTFKKIHRCPKTYGTLCVILLKEHHLWEINVARKIILLKQNTFFIYERTSLVSSMCSGDIFNVFLGRYFILKNLSKKCSLRGKPRKSV